MLVASGMSTTAEKMTSLSVAAIMHVSTSLTETGGTVAQDWNLLVVGVRERIHASSTLGTARAKSGTYGFRRSAPQSTAGQIRRRRPGVPSCISTSTRPGAPCQASRTRRAPTPTARRCGSPRRGGPPRDDATGGGRVRVPLPGPALPAPRAAHCVLRCAAHGPLRPPAPPRGRRRVLGRTRPWARCSFASGRGSPQAAGDPAAAVTLAARPVCARRAPRTRAAPGLRPLVRRTDVRRAVCAPESPAQAAEPKKEAASDAKPKKRKLVHQDSDSDE